jgi:hypothetical protein
MIVGHGDIASVLKDRDDIIYFASGVSNSNETRWSEFKREFDLVMLQSGHLVYFSSLCVFYSDTLYAEHKRKMEKIIKRTFENYTIVRLGNITWGDNPNTIINFLRNKIKNNEPFEVQNTQRYVIGKEEFLHWVDLIPEWSCEMNITGQLLTITEIVRRIKLCQL